MNKFTIVVDSREQKPFSFRRTAACEGVEVRALPTGDYSIAGLEDILTVERKASTGELAGNVQDERFERELARLRDFEHAWVVCQFTLADVLAFPAGSGIPRSRWRTMRMRGPYLLRRVSQLMVEYGVPFLFCGEQAQEMALSLMKRVWEAHGQGPTE